MGPLFDVDTVHVALRAVGGGFSNTQCFRQRFSGSTGIARGNRNVINFNSASQCDYLIG